MPTAYRNYDRTKTYQWNYDNAPEHNPDIELERAPIIGEFLSSNASGDWRNGDQDWTFCGLKIPSPLGISAGPLLNGRWVLYYSRLGFDVLTYKTVRSRYRECYAQPNLQPIKEAQVVNGQVTTATDEMTASWAISFGMPSMPPEVWARDITWTREHLASEKLLSVSVVATPEPDWSLKQVADDYAACAHLASKAGADCIELNFSCPNVSSADGQLYQDPESARIVLDAVRQRVSSVPLLIKIGHVASEEAAICLLQACDGYLQAISMTNCLACHVQTQHDQSLLFDGKPRGIGGSAILESSVAQVQMFSELSKREKSRTHIIGVGGVSNVGHVVDYLESGAESVQLATAAMLV